MNDDEILTIQLNNTEVKSIKYIRPNTDSVDQDLIRLIVNKKCLDSHFQNKNYARNPKSDYNHGQKNSENMIKKILIAGALLFMCSHSYSQEHQISAGMGIGSTNQILDVFMEIGTGFSGIFFNNYNLSKTKTLNEFRLAYAYTPKERWHYGGAFSYSQSEYDVNYRNEKIGEKVNTYYTVAAETSYSFLKKEKLNLYALLGAGATFVTVKNTDYSDDTTTDDNDTIFNFQVTPIGIRYGKQWGGFAELGFGYRGVLTFGAFYNFN